ncbi:MAG: DUF523 domain-containing protein [Calditrichia bacterium]
MEKILVSSCLTGQNVRYDGKVLREVSAVLRNWKEEGRLVEFCPEVGGGLTIPRSPSEIEAGSGFDVFGGNARIMNIRGEDVSDNFISGARRALEIVKSQHIRIAILKSHSPSCGIGRIYDGGFSGTLKDGDGVTAALLKSEGVLVFTEEQLAEAGKMLDKLEQTNES